MSIPVDLESLREIFADHKTHVAVGKVVKLSLAADRSVLRAQCSVLTQDRDIVARVCWDSCGVNSGSFMFPAVGDLVLLEFAEGDHEQAYVTKRLSSKVDKIPTQAVGGHMVHRAVPGKKTYLMSDTQILIGLGGDHTDPAEPLVLGNTLKTSLSTILGALATQAQALNQMASDIKTVMTDLATHTHTSGAPGSPTTPPVTASAYTTGASAMDTAKTAMTTAKTAYNGQKTSPVDDSAMLSSLAFTEKGGA